MKTDKKPAPKKKVKVAKASPVVTTQSKLDDYGADLICERIANAEFYSDIAESIGVARSSMIKWLDDNHAGLYAHAREARADKLAEDVLEIADDGRRDYVVGEDGKAIVDHDHIQRSKLRVDSRKWLVSKMFPKRYGDKVSTELSTPDGPLKIESSVTLTAEECYFRLIHGDPSKK